MIDLQLIARLTQTPIGVAMPARSIALKDKPPGRTAHVLTLTRLNFLMEVDL